MPKKEHARRVLDDNYDKYAVLEELQDAHKRINDMLVADTVANLTTDYEAADLPNAAAIATAFNATNAAINAILEKIRLST